MAKLLAELLPLLKFLSIEVWPNALISIIESYIDLYNTKPKTILRDVVQPASLRKNRIKDVEHTVLLELSNNRLVCGSSDESNLYLGYVNIIHN